MDAALPGVAAARDSFGTMRGGRFVGRSSLIAIERVSTAIAVQYALEPEHFGFELAFELSVNVKRYILRERAHIIPTAAPHRALCAGGRGR